MSKKEGLRIDEALKETGMAEDIIDPLAYSFVKTDDNRCLYWYDKKSGDELEAVALNAVIGKIWIPYYVEQGIRPEKAGELWVKDLPLELYHYHTKIDRDDALVVVGDSGICGSIEGMVHGRNGWTRLFPTVEEDVEIIEIENVKWKHEYKQNGGNIVYPVMSGIEGGNYTLKDKPPMRMILKIPTCVHGKYSNDYCEPCGRVNSE